MNYLQTSLPEIIQSSLQTIKETVINQLAYIDKYHSNDVIIVTLFSIIFILISVIVIDKHEVKNKKSLFNDNKISKNDINKITTDKISCIYELMNEMQDDIIKINNGRVNHNNLFHDISDNINESLIISKKINTKINKLLKNKAIDDDNKVKVDSNSDDESNDESDSDSKDVQTNLVLNDKPCQWVNNIMKELNKISGSTTFYTKEEIDYTNKVILKFTYILLVSSVDSGGFNQYNHGVDLRKQIAEYRYEIYSKVWQDSFINYINKYDMPEILSKEPLIMCDY